MKARHWIVLSGVLAIAWLVWRSSGTSAKGERGLVQDGIAQENVRHDPAESDLVEVAREGEVRVAQAGDLDAAGQDDAPRDLESTEGTQPTAAPDEVEVHLRVVDPMGEPIALEPVKVSLRLFFDANGDWTFTVPADFRINPSKEFFVSNVSDEAGRLKLRIKRSLFLAAPCAFDVENSATGAFARVDGIALPASDRLDLGTVALYRPREKYPVPLLRGTVRDTEGELVHGATGTISDILIVEEDSSGAEVEVERDWPISARGEVVIARDGSFEAFGPPGARVFDLEFRAPSFASEGVWGVAIHRQDVRVVMARRFTWHGILQAPEDGPPITAYGVWVSEEGQGNGVSPQKDGQFYATGTTRAISIKVCFPGLGAPLFEKKFSAKDARNGRLGKIDIRPHVQILDAVCAAEDGSPWANTKVQVHFAGERAAKVYETKIQVETDDKGRLLAAIPLAATNVRVAREGRSLREVILGGRHMHWTLE